MRANLLSFISFRTLTGIKFVKFEMCKSSLVDIREREAIPPPESIGPNGVYLYAPKPPDAISPVDENHLMQSLPTPRHAEDESVCLERFPKKLPGSMRLDGDRPGLGLKFRKSRDGS